MDLDLTYLVDNNAWVTILLVGGHKVSGKLLSMDELDFKAYEKSPSNIKTILEVDINGCSDHTTAYIIVDQIAGIEFNEY